MAMMTPEEIKQKVPKGYYVKEKCDNCDMPIMSSLVYKGSTGSYCSNPCYEEAELDSEQRDRRRKRTRKKGRARTTDTTSEKESTMIKGGSKDKAGTAPKKKRTREAEPDDRPRKKKKRPPADEDEDAAPRRSKAARKGAKGKPAAKRKKKTDNPYSRPSSAVYRAFNMAKEGTTVKAIEKLCDELGVGSARVFNELRKEEFKESQWSYSEDKKGRIEIDNIT